MYSKSKLTGKKFLVSIIMSITSIALAITCITGCGTTKVEDFSYSIENNIVIINGYLGTEAKIKIPDKIEGSKVTTIGEDAFDHNDMIESIEIPDSVTTIEESAIHHCDNLTSITMSDSLYNTYIDDNGEFSYTIYGCPNLYINGVLMDAEYGRNKPRVLKRD